MAFSTLSKFLVGKTTVQFLTDENQRVGMVLFPTALADQLAFRRTHLRGEPFADAIPQGGDLPAIVLDPLVHVKLTGDEYTGGFAQGRTMRSSSSNERFRFAGQTCQTDDTGTTVTTRLSDPTGLLIEHRLYWLSDGKTIRVDTSFFNNSSCDVTLELLTTFAISGISCFHGTDSADRLMVHRFRSAWSAEGRLESRTLEDLHLERSWIGWAAISERFGQVGSMPVRGWFPFVAVEDTKAGVVWGAQLAWAGSWQMEVAHRHDDVCISGGLADREFGHWMKRLSPGESLNTPAATLACVQGGLDDLSDLLTSAQQEAMHNVPACEEDLPIVFNEYCTSWGNPTHDSVLALADRLRGSDVSYLVIDAGWYRSISGRWDQEHGDWIPNPAFFPGGLEATAKAVHERGLIPGLWFEMETVGVQSTAFSLIDHMLQRDGKPLTSSGRHYWNLCDPFVVEYLSKRVIDQLERCGFGYLKVDYNDTIGIGADGCESLGEALRRQTEGTYRLFDRIRARLPNLVIENCSSGGHRNEPSMIARTSMCSFSDAHELVEIPIVAANMHRLMLPRQSQVWAVLHREDTSQRLVYSLSAGFLGRLCLSGDIHRLTDSQWQLVTCATGMYRQAAPIIRDGVSRRYGEAGASWRHPTGWQAVVRTGPAGTLVVIHTFKGSPGVIRIPISATSTAPKAVFSVEQNRVSMSEQELVVSGVSDWCGLVVLI